jgi:hypothetical protein
MAICKGQRVDLSIQQPISGFMDTRPAGSLIPQPASAAIDRYMVSQVGCLN